MKRGLVIDGEKKECPFTFHTAGCEKATGTYPTRRINLPRKVTSVFLPGDHSGVASPQKDATTPPNIFYRRQFYEKGTCCFATDRNVELNGFC
jgi:hypothetical protein